MKLNAIVVGRVISETNDGATVDIHGEQAFLPREHTPVDIHRLLGGLHHFKILEKPSDSPVIVKHFRGPVYHYYVSPRAPIDTYEIGQQCIGIVRNVAPFGAFIDLGKMDGLLLFEGTEFSADNFKSEQVLNVSISRIEVEKEKLYLEACP